MQTCHATLLRQKPTLVGFWPVFIFTPNFDDYNDSELAGEEVALSSLTGDVLCKPLIMK